MRILAVIPARSGSVRLPGKNLRTVGGVSLVRRAVEQALAVKRDYHRGIRVALVSGGLPEDETERIELEGKQADYVLRRDADDAHGRATGVNGWGDGEHAAGFAIERTGGPRTWDAVMLLQPTSPLRSSRTIDGCLKTYLSGAYNPWSARSVVTCCEEGVPNGVVYVANARRFYEARSWGYASAIWYAQNPSATAEWIDVDCEFDIELAERLCR